MYWKELWSPGGCHGDDGHQGAAEKAVHQADLLAGATGIDLLDAIVRGECKQVVAAAAAGHQRPAQEWAPLNNSA